MTGKFAKHQPVHVIVSDVDTRRKLVRLLDKLALNVRTFDDINAFLAEPLSQAPSCLITDAVISDTDAVALIRDMREHGLHTPIVVLADGDQHINRAVDAIKAGAVDFFERPIAERDFIERIRVIIERNTN